jgi:hypothetical protein
MQKQTGAQGSSEQRPAGDNNGQGREVSRKPIDGRRVKPGDEKPEGDKPENMQRAADRQAAWATDGDPNAAPAPAAIAPSRSAATRQSNAAQKTEGNPAPSAREQSWWELRDGAAPEQGRSRNSNRAKAPTAEGGAKPSATATFRQQQLVARGSSPNEGSLSNKG